MDEVPRCTICDRENEQKRAEMRRLMAEGIPREMLGVPALATFRVPDHDTDDHRDEDFT